VSPSPASSTSKSQAINCDHLKKLIREVPDFPKPGILFYDITTLLKDKVGFATLIDALSAHYMEKDIDLVLGIEARGFLQKLPKSPISLNMAATR
jgi:adenine phosphoribosyltransferase